MNVLPLDKWTALYDPNGELLETFRLFSYSVIDGTPKMMIDTKGGRTFQTALTEAKLGHGLAVRFYVPIELHQVPGVGLSPKVVYTLPRGCRIEEFRAEAPPLQQLYEKARNHKIIRLKG